MNRKRLKIILNNAKKKKVLVIGDLMLDKFVWGRVERLSPEAPVPIVNVEKESYYPGGASNVARNLRSFVEKVSIIGAVGKDFFGKKLIQILHHEGIDTSGIYTDSTFPTILKTRIIAHQQLLRIDREQLFVHETGNDFITKHLLSLLNGIDGVIVEDYAKGFLDQKLIDIVSSAKLKNSNLIITADPNPKNDIEWNHFTTIKPNRTEAFFMANKPMTKPDKNPLNDQYLIDVGKTLFQRWNINHLLITLSEQGMILFRPDVSPCHVPTHSHEVFDVSGAGDTSIALYTLGLLGGANPEEATILATLGSSIVVGKLGTATCSQEELEKMVAS